MEELHLPLSSTSAACSASLSALSWMLLHGSLVKKHNCEEHSVPGTKCIDPNNVEVNNRRDLDRQLFKNESLVEKNMVVCRE